MTRALVLVLGAVALVYLRVLGLGYVWDDHLLVEGNRALAEPSWSTIFQRDLWWGTGGYATPYFRPALTLSLLLDRGLTGSAAWAAHLQSLGWHLLATALVGVVVGRAAGDRAGAFAAAVFGLHPIQSEAVVWVSARNDLLAGVGILVAIAAEGRLGAVALGTLLAALSKETGYTTPLLLAFWSMAWGRRPARAVLLASVGGLLVAAVLRRFATLGVPFPAFPFGADDPLAGVWALLRYTSWFVWPWPLTSTSTVYGPPPGPMVWLAGFGAIALALLAVRRDHDRMAGLVLFSLTALAPSAGATILYYTLGERYLYVAVIGFAAAVGPLLARWPLPAALAPLLAAALAISVRLGDWTDDTRLFVAAAARQPDAYSLSLAGKVLIDAGRPAEALDHLERSLRVVPTYPFGCRYISSAARDTLSWTETRTRLPEWLAAGCRGIPGFDDAVAMSAARAGDWDWVAPYVATVTGMDHSGRLNLVRAAVFARQGDLLSFAMVCMDQEDGAGGFRARTLPLLQQPLASDPAPRIIAAQPQAPP